MLQHCSNVFFSLRSDVDSDIFFVRRTLLYHGLMSHEEFIGLVFSRIVRFLTDLVPQKGERQLGYQGYSGGFRDIMEQ